MSRSVRLHSEARAEVFAAATHYEVEQAGLGRDFIREYRRAMTGVLDFPDSGSAHGKICRKVLLRRFPYNVFYRWNEDSKEIEVLGVMHQRELPDARLIGRAPHD